MNPFSPEHGELVNLSTAAEAPPEVAKDLLEAYKVGEKLESIPNFHARTLARCSIYAVQ